VVGWVGWFQVSSAALVRAVIAFQGAAVFSAVRVELVQGLARVLLHDPPSDYAHAVASSVLLELTCRSVPL
jgi:hypothetical protein